MTDPTRGKAPPKSSPASPPRSRSGDFSRDPRFDADEQFEVVSAAAGAEEVAAAMRHFVVSGDEERLARAIAIYARSARARGEPIERVLATINGVVEGTEGTPVVGSEGDPSRLRQLVMRGLLLTFYGADAVSDDEDAHARRTAPPATHPGRETDGT